MVEPDESTPLFKSRTNSLASSEDFSDELDDDELEVLPSTSARKEARAAERLLIRLLAVDDGDELAHERILRQSLRLDSMQSPLTQSGGRLSVPRSDEQRRQKRFRRRVGLLLGFVTVILVVGGVLIAISSRWVHVGGPLAQPIGPYRLLERQEGFELLNYYDFYEGRDSQGSNGFNMYVGRDKAVALGILNVTLEKDVLDVFDRRRLQGQSATKATASVSSDALSKTKGNASVSEEHFLYMGSAATEAGPRDSIRLEGKRRFDRGLFIIDVRHMPAGCGVWPAFWMTDEANWPVNGEIDIVEGVNFQTTAKTALHSTKGCSMTDIPIGTMTGGWDTATGIPDAKTGIPDTTFRYAQNCFVYDPHQWINQGCVAVDLQGGTIGAPLNDNGGGVYALEWDPINRHIRSWIFTPHTTVPKNLVEAIRTASYPEGTRIMPNPELWPLPYGYFSIGEGTDCPANKFKRMRLVFNTAFCGSVAGNRFQLDCPKIAKKFDTCNDWVASNPSEMSEAYWKVRGVYVYEREWEKAWAA